MKTAICAIIKNEHRFLEEWIEWHLGLGFNAIHLFEDKGSDTHEEICAKYSNVSLKRYENDEQIRELLSAQGHSKRQLVLYQWFTETYQDKYDWVAFIDLDEFIMFEEGYTLNKLCNEFSNYPTVYLFWKMKGASGYLNQPRCEVMKAYTETCPCLEQDINGWNCKSLVNLKANKGLWSLHHGNEGVCTNLSTSINTPVYCKAWINHYFTKSWEDWLNRIYKKGGTMKGHRTLALFFEVNLSMEHLREELISSVQDRIPEGTYWLDKKKGTIAGGNVNKIMCLNGTPIINIVGSKPSSLKEALDLAKAKAMRLGFNQIHTNNEKLIHFIWFGKNPLTKLTVKCIESWKKFAPDYTYCLWTEDSFDVNSHEFTKNAYKDKAWAFVADYVRLWAIYNFGGIYFDLDVELLKRIDDLPNNWFALEKGTNSIALGLGFGADKHSEIILDMLKMFDYFHFHKNKRDKFISPALLTNYLISKGYKQQVGVHKFNKFTIYPPEYFCPQSWHTGEIETTENTIAIHRYTKLW